MKINLKAFLRIKKPEVGAREKANKWENPPLINQQLLPFTYTNTYKQEHFELKLIGLWFFKKTMKKIENEGGKNSFRDLRETLLSKFLRCKAICCLRIPLLNTISLWFNSIRVKREVYAKFFPALFLTKEVFRFFFKRLEKSKFSFTPNQPTECLSSHKKMNEFFHSGTFLHNL